MSTCPDCGRVRYAHGEPDNEGKAEADLCWSTNDCLRYRLAKSDAQTAANAAEIARLMAERDQEKAYADEARKQLAAACQGEAQAYRWLLDVREALGLPSDAMPEQIAERAKRLVVFTQAIREAAVRLPEPCNYMAVSALAALDAEVSHAD